MKESSVLMSILIIFLISLILFHGLGFYLFCKHFGTMGFFWFSSFLALAYSLMAIIAFAQDSNESSR